MLGGPRCRIFFADNSKTYFAIYPGRERRGMESISFRVMTRQTASQAIYSFIPPLSSSTRTPPLLVFALSRPFDSCFARQQNRFLDVGSAPLCFGRILISRCHDIYHLGVLAPLTGASGICFSFFSSAGACLLPFSKGQRGSMSQACYVPVVKNQYRLSLSFKLFAHYNCSPCRPS